MPKPKKHKRKGPKSTRAGCLLCQPHKHQGNGDRWSELAHAERKRRVAARQQIGEAA